MLMLMIFVNEERTKRLSVDYSLKFPLCVFPKNVRDGIKYIREYPNRSRDNICSQKCFTC